MEGPSKLQGLKEPREKSCHIPESQPLEVAEDIYETAALFLRR